MKKIILVLVLLIVHCTLKTEHCEAQVWSQLGSGMNGSVYSLVVFNNELIIGGNFTTAGGVSVNRIVKWNGTTWSPLGSGMDGYVYCLTVYNNELIAGGDFITAGGMSVKNIAKWNGTNWQPLSNQLFSNTIWGGVFCLTVYNNELIVGGTFDSIAGMRVNNIAKWNGSTWSPLGNGLIYQGLLNFDGARVLTTFNNELIVGGAFSIAGSVSAYSIAKWNGAIWSSLGSGVGGSASVPAWALALTVFNNELICGGSFYNAGGEVSYFIAKWNGGTWSGLGSGIGPYSNYDNMVYALAVYNNDLITGGLFENAGGTSALNIAKWNGATWSSFGGGTNGEVLAFAVYNNSLIVGGKFTTVGNILANRIAKWGAGVGIKQINQNIPDNFVLEQNFPNPFNPSTNIKYQITNSKLVTLKVYDILGKEIATLVNEKQSPGVYEVTFDGNDLPSGIYFYTLTSGEFKATKRFVLIK